MSFDLANLRLRLITSLALAPLVLAAVYLGNWAYQFAVIFVIAFATQEWLQLTKGSLALRLLGIPYIGGFGIALLYLRVLPEGALFIYFVLATVWGTDIGAYLAGRAIGGPKLAPRISPSKTWAGLLGGILLACVFGYGVAACLSSTPLQPLPIVVLSGMLAVVAQGGDLFESSIKRQAGVKESGSLIPGHGGILDRIDGLIFATIGLALLVAFTHAPAAAYQPGQ